MERKRKRPVRPKKKKKLDGKRVIPINKKLHQDFLTELMEKLEESHVKRYTFIVKGKSLYTSGVFWSEKNKRKYVFRSTYEFAYFYQLEANEKVTAYIVEPFEVPYLDPKYKFQRVYKPDVLVHYVDGTIKLLEIKPKSRLGSKEVMAKATGAKNYLKLHYPKVHYEFITEEEIFKDKNDYKKLLGEIDPEKNKEKKIKRQARLKTIEDKDEMDYFRSKLPTSLKNASYMII